MKLANNENHPYVCDECNKSTDSVIVIADKNVCFTCVKKAQTIATQGRARRC